MFAYELQKARRADLQQRADAWRLAKVAKAARDTGRTTRKDRRSALRTNAAQDPAAESPRRPRGRVRRALHPHSAA